MLDPPSGRVVELCDAVLCADGPVRSIAELSLVAEHRRGHCSGYAALARGRVDINRLWTALSAVPVPRAADGRLVLAVDITSWLRPEAHTSRQRILCHTYGRGKDQHIMVPGWRYSVIVALETGRSSWTAPLDAVRLAPGADAASVTAAQVRGVVDRLIAAGQWQRGDPDILLVADAGYDGPRLAHVLGDLPITVLMTVSNRNRGCLGRGGPFGCHPAVAGFVPGLARDDDHVHRLTTAVHREMDLRARPPRDLSSPSSSTSDEGRIPLFRAPATC